MSANRVNPRNSRIYEVLTINIVLLFVLLLSPLDGALAQQGKSRFAWNDQNDTDLRLPVTVHLIQAGLPPRYIESLEYAIESVNSMLRLHTMTLSPAIIDTQAGLQQPKAFVIVGFDPHSDSVAPQHTVPDAVQAATISGLTGKGLDREAIMNLGGRIQVRGSTLNLRNTANPQCSVGIYSVVRFIGHIRILVAGNVSAAEVRRCLFQMLTYAVGFNLFMTGFNESHLKAALSSIRPPTYIDIADAIDVKYLMKMRVIAQTYYD